jgi:hypothetical protein
MNLTITLEQFDNEYVYICESIKNNIMNEGVFYRILYSTNLFSCNGIYILLNINYLSIERYYNKYKYNFDITNYEFLINKIKEIEYSILQKISLENKYYNLKIYEQLKNGSLKIDMDNSSNCKSNLIILKISGIWETKNEYGLTYKFIKK